MTTAESFSPYFLGQTALTAQDIRQLQEMLRQAPYFDAGRWLLAAVGEPSGEATAQKENLPPAVRLWLSTRPHLPAAAEPPAEGPPASSALEWVLNQGRLESGEEEMPAVRAVEEAPSAKAEDETAEPVGELVAVQPAHTQDYFAQQGVTPGEEPARPVPQAEMMVVRSFADWMVYFQKTAREAAAEEQSQRALRALRQREKLAAAAEEEDEDEIPEDVFRMAVASIAVDETASEPLAEILVNQGKWDRAIDMYRRLKAANPAKSAYFAAKIEAVEGRKAE